MHARPATQAPMPRSQQMMLMAAQRSGLPSPTSPVPPAPRSLANPASPTMVTVGGYPSMAPKPRSAVAATATAAATPSPNIDLHKYKTKLCRNHQQGLPCPFEDRCVFAHGDDQIMKAGTVPPTPLHHTPDSSFERAPRSATNSAYGSNAYEFPTYVPEPTLRRPRRQSFTDISQDPTTASDEDNLASPPTYEAFLAHTVTAMPFDEPASPMESSMPARFRFDPYSYNGFVYVRA